jgi:hypothetical protein
MNEGGFRAAKASMSQGLRATSFRNRPPGPADVVASPVVASPYAAMFQDPAPTIAPSLGPRDPLEELKVSTTTIERVEWQALPTTGSGAYRPRSWRRTRGRRVASAALGMALVGGGAYAATNWVVGLGAGSSGEGQSASVQNLTFTAVSSPAATNQLYPGGNGDVVLTIANPNPYPVTVTGVNLPANTVFASGFTNANLVPAQTGCSSSTSNVIWNFSTVTSGTAHTLTSAVTIGPSGNANNPLTVTLTNDASMTTTAPAACQSTFFSMPSLTGIAATGGSATVTSTPVVDGWTS